MFPPDIDASKAIVRCGDLIFKDKEEAQRCFEELEGLVTAEDDCKPTRIDFDAVQDSAETCSATVRITATALGCEERPAEDVTVLNIPVAICCDDNAIDLQPGMGCNGVDDDCKCCALARISLFC